MKVSAVVVSHGHAAEPVARSPRSCLRSTRRSSFRTSGLRRRCAGGSARAREPTAAQPGGEREPGDRRDRGRVRSRRQPGRDPGARCRSRARCIRRRPHRCGIAGPQMRWPDGTWQPSRRRFPTVRGTLVRRTPLRRLRTPYEKQRDHYHLDERPTAPVQANWMLGAFLLMRRSMLDEIGGWDAGFRHYCEDIDLLLPRDAGRLGALVRPRSGRDARLRSRDRPRVHLAPHALARPRYGPLRAQASRAPARPVKDDQYARQAEDWTERAYADAAAYLAHRAELVIGLGAELRPGRRYSISPAGMEASGSCWSPMAFGIEESTRPRRWSRRRGIDLAIAPWSWPTT